jgi:uncharacterized delta-60 repeat protein
MLRSECRRGVNPSTRKYQLGRRFLIPILSCFLAAVLASPMVSTSANAQQSSGDLDSTFSSDGKLTDWLGAAYAVAIQPDGRIVAAGATNNGGSFAVARYNADGSSDLSFGGGDGKVSTEIGFSHESANAVALQSDGKIVVLGTTWDGSASQWGHFSLVRYNPDGSLDPAFGGGDGIVVTENLGTGWVAANSIAIQSDGKIVAAGRTDYQAYDFPYLTIVRYNPDGSLDLPFGGGDGQATIPGGSAPPVENATSVALQPDGKIVAAGYMYGPTDFSAVVRFDSNGSLDQTFGGGDGIVYTEIGKQAEIGQSLAIHSDGKIVVGSQTTDFNSACSVTLFRYTSDGSLDATFDSDGKVVTPICSAYDATRNVAVQSDGKVMAAGHTDDASNNDFALARYNSNGTLDTAFGGGDGVATIDFNISTDLSYAMALDSQGRAVLVGRSSGNVALARFLVNQSATRTNYALASNGATATASSTHSAGYAPAGAVDGDRKGSNWAAGGGWNDATESSYPDWLQVDFGGPRTIDRIGVFTVQDTYWAPAEPTAGMTFSQYGATDFEIQYWVGSGWVTIPGGTVAGNINVWREIAFPAVTTTKIRVVVNNALAGYSRITEMEAWGGGQSPTPVPGGGINVALAANGGVANASSQYSAAYPISSLNNGDRKGTNWGSGGGWNDADSGAYPDWAEISFSGTKTINEINVFTLQDAYWDPAEPTPDMLFGAYGITAFDVQYWDGAAWATVPGGSVAGNSNVWRRFTFPTLSTQKIRVIVGASSQGYSRITEIEAITAAPTYGGRTNHALTSNGGAASASSTYSDNYPVASANDGDRRGLNWGAGGGGWNDATNDFFPDWIEVEFSGNSSIDEIDLITVQDSYWDPAEPAVGMTFSQYGITDFDVQYWNGSGWVSVPGGSVIGNNNVWRKITFSPVATTKIRISVNNALGGYSRVTEVEAWGEVPGG